MHLEICILNSNPNGCLGCLMIFLRQLFGLERIEDTYFKLETMLNGVRHANYSNTNFIPLYSMCAYIVWCGWVSVIH